MQIFSPIPEAVLGEAVKLWSSEFGWLSQRVVASNGAVALNGDEVRGVVGLRDHNGGFLSGHPATSPFLFRPAPPTADLVIDGIVVRSRRCGIGRALIGAAEIEARRRQRRGLRAEVRLGNPAALAFYAELGFSEETRGRFGWPWSGIVSVMRKPISCA